MMNTSKFGYSRVGLAVVSSCVLFGCAEVPVSTIKAPQTITVDQRTHLPAYLYKKSPYEQALGSAQKSVKDGKLVDAETQLNQALTLEPRSPFPHRELARLYDKEGRSQEALREWRSSVELPKGIVSSDQTNPIVLTHIADLCLKSGLSADSQKYYLQAAHVAEGSKESSPSEARARAYWMCATQSDLMGTKEEALRYASQAVSLEPNNGKYRYQHARDLVLSGKLIDAIDEFDRALQLVEPGTRPVILSDPLRKMALMQNTRSSLKISEVNGKVVQTDTYYPIDSHHSYFHGDAK